MNRHVSSLTCAALLVLTLVLTGCDRYGGLVDASSDTDDLAFEITVRASEPGARIAGIDPPDRAFEATGTIDERGAVAGNAWPDRAPAYWVGYRQFTGEAGTFEIVIEAYPTVGDRHALARGTFTLTDGSGAHAGLAARGTFTLARTDGGDVAERYTGLLE